MDFKLVVLLLLLVLYVGVAHGGEIGFDEQFAFTEDRSIPLKQLIPGTEDYYYYHCLYYQHQGDYKKVEDLLQDWVKRYNYTERVKEIRNRQAMLMYTKSPDTSIQHIITELNPQLHHLRQKMNEEVHYPSMLDQNQISRDTLLVRAFSDYSDLSGLEDAGLRFLSVNDLNPDRRRDFLRRMTRPEFPKLEKLVVDDLRYENSGGFGSLGIHGKLLRSQLEECLKLNEELINDTNFVNTLLARMRPNEDVDPRQDPTVMEAYLSDLWNFVRQLPPSFNSLKVGLVYQMLFLQRGHGVFNKELFMTYLRLPRQVFYIHPEFCRRSENRDYIADLNSDNSRVIYCPPIGNDEPLVRSFLEHFLQDAENTKEFAELIESNYLKLVFAETKILYGIGNQEAWFSLLPPGHHQTLKERVEVEFLPTNKTFIGIKDIVSLDVAVKNVSTLIIKVYRINTLNFYRDQQAEVTTAIDLDGLVANDEKVVNFSTPEIRRHNEHFEFPQLDRPGVYVIEMIGNGKSSRALIRKGRLSFAIRSGAAGQVFTIFDDENNKISSASIYLGGKEYKADESGEIPVPFSNQPGDQKIVIAHEGYAALHQFYHETEQYSLQCGIHVDRESLIEGQSANVLIRPRLLLNGNPVDVSLLETPVLTVSTTDREGIPSAREIQEFKLFNDKESVFEFKVPEKLSQLSFTIKGKVENISQGKKIDLTDSRAFEINGIEKTEKVEDFYLRHADGKFYIELLGKTGEPRPSCPIYLDLKPRYFKRTVNVTLMTDQSGRADLGELCDISNLNVKGALAAPKIWILPNDDRSYPDRIHSPEGSPIQVPAMISDDTDPKEAFSLLETRDGNFTADYSDKAKIQDGYIVISGLAAGDYELHLKDAEKIIPIKVSQGKTDGNFILSRYRYLEYRPDSPLQITGIAIDKDNKKCTVQVNNYSVATRIHAFVTRFMPAGNPMADLRFSQSYSPREITLQRPFSNYLSGRNIGDEYQYILERKFAKVVPGNLLKRPSLLLNPWSLRKTETGKDSAQAGEGWSESAMPGQGVSIGAAAPSPSGREGGGAWSDFACMDFLFKPSLVIINAKPDSNGRVVLNLDDFGAKQQLHVVAVDDDEIIYREMSLPMSADQPRDLRLDRALDPTKHFAEQKNISIVASGAQFRIEDITTAKMEAYDSLESVYRLFSTLSTNPNLAEFSFILDFVGQNIEKKHELYSKHACHELNFFLYQKDPQFFASVVKPYLRNKKDKTFMDDWLLEENLEKYLTSWKFGRLNIVERILLSRRLKGQDEIVSRHVTDKFNLIPPDIDKFNQFFDTAIKGSALETGDRFGFAGAASKIMPAKRLSAVLGLTAPSSMAKPMCRPPCPPPMLSQKAQMESDEEQSAMEDSLSTESAVAGDLSSAKEEAEIKTVRMEKKKFSKSDRNVGFAKDMKRRQEARPLFRQAEKTEEWVENNYYHLPIENQSANLITVNGFWKDYALYSGEGPFLSKNIAEASRNFSEMMFAMAVLDLPFHADTHKTKYEGGQMTMTPTTGLVLFHREIKPAMEAEKAQTILTSQNFFAQNDRYRFENNEQFDKFVTDEFQTARVYGCQVVITNPTSARKKIDVLLQIPKGALPALNGFVTRSEHRQLEPFSTQTVEFYFYFPFPGNFSHYPVHISQNEKFLAAADPFVFNVVEKLTKIDTQSWEYISQMGSKEDVLKYMARENIERLNLDLILFRLRDKAFYRQVMELLINRHVYHNQIWAYGLLHKDVPTIKEYLQFSDFSNRCGRYLDSPLLNIDPVIRYQYQHREYWPLINARVLQLGKKRKIMNQQFFEQYNAFLEYLRYRSRLDDMDMLSATYYLLLQDRVEEAGAFFDRIQSAKLQTEIQYQYLKAYLSFYREQSAESKEIALKYKDYPVDRWRNLFADILAQADEIEGKSAKVSDKEDRDQAQNKLVDTEPSLEFNMENRNLVVKYKNLKTCRINYYLMDIELLFSRNPFVQEVSGQFSMIHPNESLMVDLPQDKDTMTLDLVRKYRDCNVMIEVSGAGITRTKAYYPNALSVQIMEPYGQLKISHDQSRALLPKVYVKVFARMKGGQVQFYKDGYTDLRGRFDYASLSTNDLESVEKFSILIMSDQYGSMVREAAPPKL